MQHASIHFELKQSVAGRQINFIGLARIPAGNDQAARIGISLDLFDETRDLIDTVTLGIVTAKRAPEIAINRPKIARLAMEASRVFLIGVPVARFAPPRG